MKKQETTEKKRGKHTHTRTYQLKHTHTHTKKMMVPGSRGATGMGGSGGHPAQGGGAGQQRLPEGSATETVYGLIRDGKHAECIKFLEAELANAPNSRPALSLLGYCYYYVGNFDAAASMYDQLSRLFPEAWTSRTNTWDSLTRGRDGLHVDERGKRKEGGGGVCSGEGERGRVEKS